MIASSNLPGHLGADDHGGSLFRSITAGVPRVDIHGGCRPIGRGAVMAAFCAPAGMQGEKL